jgi:predicted acylesterase/phospholipase RssA
MESELYDETNPPKSTIKHLVISGGGLNGFCYYGVLRDSNLKGVWNIDNIKTIYGCSIGSILSAIVSLRYDWTDMDDYILKRPWENVFEPNLFSMLSSMSDKGIYTIRQIEAIMSPLLLGKDLALDITLNDFYQATNTEIHIFTTDMHLFKSVDLSYKTHPDWRLVDAIYASCAIPILFSPHTDGTTYYYDGAFFTNYPLTECINGGASPNEIIGIASGFLQKDKSRIGPDSTMIDCISVVLENILHKALSSSHSGKIGIEYIVDSVPSSISDIYNLISSREERSRLITLGSNSFHKTHLKYLDLDLDVSSLEPPLVSSEIETDTKNETENKTDTKNETEN